MRIGILQTGQAPDKLRPETGDYPEMFARLLDGNDFEFRSYLVEEMEFPADIHDCDGWLITGSRHGVYEDHPFIAPLFDFIRKAYAASVPVVGICFGHQAIAQALGGKVEQFKGGWAVGPTDYDFNGRKVTLNAWHRDQVVALPEGAERLGSNAFCENAALVYGDRAFSVQAHPEYGDDFIRGLIRHRGKGVVPDPLMEAAESRFGQTNDSAAIADQIADFFKKSRNRKV